MDEVNNMSDYEVEMSNYRTNVDMEVEDVDTYYVVATRFGSTRLGSAQARRHDIPPSCAPGFDTQSTERREPVPSATSS
ncbi:hypothetical protein Hanom_Chr10g00926991 [Helianthus anomalus]